jgi:hypothetical protein
MNRARSASGEGECTIFRVVEKVVEVSRVGTHESDRAGPQLSADTLNDVGAHGATPRDACLCSGTRRATIDAASAITRLSMINLMLRASGSGKPLTKDQGDSIDLENRKGR